LLRFIFERIVRVAHHETVCRAHGHGLRWKYAFALLDGMGEFVREQAPAFGAYRLIAARGEVDVSTRGEGVGFERLSRGAGVGIGVHAHVGKIAAEAQLHHRASLFVERDSRAAGRSRAGRVALTQQNVGANFFTGSDAATINVNPALGSDPSQIQAAGVANATGDNSIALQLAQLGQQSVAALNNQTFSGAYAQDVQTFGNALSSANNQVDNYNSVSTMLLNQRDSVSGVSLEEETTNLIAFQKAYEASAKLITTVDEMLSTVIAMKST